MQVWLASFFLEEKLKLPSCFHLFLFSPTDRRVSVVRKWNFGPVPNSNPNVELAWGATGWVSSPRHLCRLLPCREYKPKVSGMQTRPLNAHHSHHSKASVLQTIPLFFHAIMELHGRGKQNTISGAQILSSIPLWLREKSFGVRFLINALPGSERVEERKKTYG